LFASIYDLTASYDIGFAIATVLFFMSALLVLGLGRYPDEFQPGHG